MKNSYVTVTDQFCGAGGSSIGAAQSGAEIKLAINHWRLAIQTHNTNFPNVDHDCADISAVDPRRYPSTNILITSPECTNHSLAKGKNQKLYKKDLFGNNLIDPAEERSRATMWDVPRFAEFHDYEIIVVENVVDAGKWRLWDSWLHAMHALGYDHQVVYFNSMFSWPTPQSRDRMYVVFWKVGNRRPDLDFFPLAPCNQCGRNVEAVQSWKKRTRWGRYRAQYIYLCPACHKEVTPYYYAAFNAIDWTIQADRIGDREKPLKPKTLERIQYGLDLYGRKPMIVTSRYTTGIGFRVKDATEEPLPTQPGDASHAVVFPWMINTTHPSGHGHYVNGSHDPTPTQTARQSLGVVGFLNKQYAGNADPRQMSVGLDEPTDTITTQDHHALVTLNPGFITRMNDIDHGDPGRRSLPVDDPLRTIVTYDTHALIGLAPSFIAEMHGTSKAAGIDDPLMCLTAGGGHHALLSADAFLTYYYGSQNAGSIGDPLHTVTAKDRAGLVGALENLAIEDLTFRMLQPHEIGLAMAFPDQYIVLGTKRDKVKQYGNAVTPPVMEMIIRRCMESLA